MRQTEAMLSVNGLTKRFGGLVAVNEISFVVKGGEILRGFHPL